MDREARVDLIGFEGSEIKDRVYEKIEHALAGKLRVVKTPKHFIFHCKSISKEGGKHHHAITLKLESEFGLHTIQREGWNLLDVVDDSINTLEELIRREKEKLRG